MTAVAQPDGSLRFLLLGSLLAQLGGCGSSGDAQTERDAGMDPGVCCAAEALCEPHEASYPDQPSCDAAGPGCRQHTVCCDTVFCRPLASALTVQVSFSGDDVALDFEHEQGLSYLTCDHAFKLLKPGADGTWEPLVDERPWSSNGPFYLDGVYHEFVDPIGECTEVSCVGLHDDALQRVEYLPVEGADPHPDVPDLVKQTYRGPLRVQVEVHADPQCLDVPPITKTFDVVTAP
jgi:hypothetical protein